MKTLFGFHFYSTPGLCALVLVLCVCLGFQCAPTTGTISDTDSGVLLNADFTPAKNASIKVYVYRDTILAYETVTDSNGKYSLDNMQGLFSIWAEKDSFVAFQDSVLLAHQNSKIGRDTLLVPGRYTGRIGLEPGDPYSAVTVNALGTHIHANVNDTGGFTLSGLADGEYVLQFSTHLAGYVPTFSSPVIVKSGRTTLGTEPFKIKYAGIPYVTGIVASFDTLGSSVFLRWNKTRYFNFQEYVVFRRDPAMMSGQFDQIANTTDTLFEDKLNMSFFDSNLTLYQYKVVIRDKFESLGRSYGSVEVGVCSPAMVTTEIVQNTVSIIKSTPGSAMMLVADISNPTRKIKSIKWRNQASDIILRSVSVTNGVKSISDTLHFIPAALGIFTISTEVEDEGGTSSISNWSLNIQRAVMLSVFPDDTLTGVTIVKIQTDASVKQVMAGLEGRYGQPVSVSNGFAACTLDTRIHFPAAASVLTVREGLAVLDTARVLLNNADPIIGCWGAQSDSLFRECYHADGSIVTTRNIGWLVGWTRNGYNITLLQATSNGITFRPYFTDYNHCTINGTQYVRTGSLENK